MTIEAPPKVLPSADWRFPVGRQFTLANGMRVLAYHCPGQFVASVTLWYDVPLSAEPRALEGVAGLAARCLVRGAGALSADDFADALAACGADLEAAVQPDGFAVRLSAPVTALARGVDLLSMAVTQPAYQHREFDQERRLRLQEIEHAKAYPNSVSVERLNALLFGDARAGRPTRGLAETVTAVTREDMAEYADRHLHSGVATLVVAGDLEAGDLGEVGVEALAERALGGWPARGDGPIEPAPSPVRDAPRMLVIDWPDAVQGTVRIAGPGVTRADARWAATFVANYVVGGSFGSRLNTVLREQRGLTYGVGSNLDSTRQTGLLAVSASVRTAAAADAVGETLSILQAAAGSLTDEEVRVGVRAATDSAPLGFERAAAVAARVEMLLGHRLPLDHVDVNLERLRSVTAPAANATYAEVVHPERFAVVVAAPADAVVPGLDGLGHADVDVVSRP